MHRYAATIDDSFVTKTFNALRFAAVAVGLVLRRSAAGLSRPFSATMQTEIGFGSRVMCNSFTRFPKL
jgi:hypothetical protein